MKFPILILFLLMAFTKPKMVIQITMYVDGNSMHIDYENRTTKTDLEMVEIMSIELMNLREHLNKEKKKNKSY